MVNVMEMASDQAVAPVVPKEGFERKNKLNQWLNEKYNESTDSRS